MPPRNVAVLRALQLGDMLCAIPALRALRAAWPHARITLIGLPWAAQFARRFSRYLDDFLAFPGYPGLPEQAADADAFAAFVQQARARCFDLALQMHGDGRVTNRIVATLGARRTTGFTRFAEDGFLHYPEEGAEVRRLLALTQFLGAPCADAALEFPLGPEDEAELAAFAAARGLPAGPCICLHPGARSADKRWPPAHFAAIGDALHARYGLPIVLTGSAAEMPLTAAVREAMRAPAADAAGPISIGALAAQIARACLLVTNDTGVSHIAAALRVPSVVVFISTDLARWAPLDGALHRPVRDPSCSRIRRVLGEACRLLGAQATAPAPGLSLLPG